MSVPSATMRLQLHHGFTFADAARLIPYVRDLGISHLYVSPILTARPGSMHGYDVIDPSMVSPELGGETGLRNLVAELRRAGLGLVVDFVPNHMAVGGVESPWWGDVLQNGAASRYARYFDIDWNAANPVLRGRVLAPFLGEPYGEALLSGAITLSRNGESPLIRYLESRFPIRPEDYSEIAAAPLDAYDPATEKGRQRLHRLLERQHYRLAWWRSAGDEINWRRFFDINGLAALRIEDETVFEAAHGTLLYLYREGLFDGVRIDHVDGLADPPAYCKLLRARLDALSSERPSDAPQGPAWIVVEKILAAGERLPDDWAVDGTSGYDFMDTVSALLHDGSGERALARLWGSISARPMDFATEQVTARRDILEWSFTAQLDALTACLHDLARMRPETRDTTFAAIRRALVALLVHFPVYRSYTSVQRSPAEARIFARALAGALKEFRAADRPTLALLERWLGGEVSAECSQACRRAIVRFQQLSVSLAAKAVEDTAYYRYGVLLSRNEVGADQGRFSATTTMFHAECLERHEHFPNAMLATATHDHKRGEDVRARLAVLSELPDEWGKAVRRWLGMNAPHRRFDKEPVPSPGDEAMLYQMIVGAWPVMLRVDDEAGLYAYARRLADWQLKALREAKLATDWTAPNLEYENRARSFVFAIMGDNAGFVAEAASYAHRIGPAGALNGLSQTLLKLTVPGVPDLYQGTEFWDQSLVDPDNRDPVDFAQRVDALRTKLPLQLLANTWRDGRVKQVLIHRVLGLRRAVPELFRRGSYVPLEVTGPLAAHVTAFVRSLGGTHCLVVAPRLPAGLVSGGDSIVIASNVWQGTALRLPEAMIGQNFADVISGASLAPASGTMPLGDVLTELPLALLVTG